MSNVQNIVESYLGTVLESGITIIAACIILGVIIKRWVPDEVMQNKFIPTVNTIVGGFLGIVFHSTWASLGEGLGPVHYFIYGAICGVLASPIYDKFVGPLLDTFLPEKKE